MNLTAKKEKLAYKFIRKYKNDLNKPFFHFTIV